MSRPLPLAARAPVAQLDRAPDYESGGRRSKPSGARHSQQQPPLSATTVGALPRVRRLEQPSCCCTRVSSLDQPRQPLGRGDQARSAEPRNGIFRVVGKGVVTGAADDDPSAIGTYSSAGAAFGLSILWIAPLLLPMMVVVVYLSAKIGQVYGKGLFACIRDQFPRWVLGPLLVLAFVGNIIEAAADLGGIGSALNLLLPVPIPILVTGSAMIIYAIQYFGSYEAIRALFRWLPLMLFAYVGAAIMARPRPAEVLYNTFVPHIRFNAEFLSIIVACIGTS